MKCKTNWGNKKHLSSVEKRGTRPLIEKPKLHVLQNVWPHMSPIIMKNFITQFGVFDQEYSKFHDSETWYHNSVAIVHCQILSFKFYKN